MADRRLGVLVAGVLVVLAIGVVALGDPVSGIVTDARPADGYRVVYRIEDRSGATVTQRTEVVEVRRPYSGRVEQLVRGRYTTGQISNREFQWQLEEDHRLQFGARRAPGGPTRGVSYTALADAVDAGVIEAGGRGRAAGRECTWFASSAPFNERLSRPTRASRVETCVDPAGIVLREVWTKDRSVIRIIEAADLRVRPPSPSRFLDGVDPEDADVSQPEIGQFLNAQTRVADDVDVGKPKITIDVPTGWKLDRGAVVVSAPAGTRPTQVSSRAYVRGSQLAVVEIALREEYEPTWPANEGDPIVVPIGDGRVVYLADRIEVRVSGDGGFARIAAPSLEIARAFAAGLDSAG